MIKKADDILAFWFHPDHHDFLFAKNESFDEQIRTQFLTTWEAACEGLLVDWRDSLHGRLAEIIVLDQFSRNLMRHDNRSFSQDKMALILAQELVKQDGFEQLTTIEKQFAYMPFMHSESAAIHAYALPLFESLGDDNTLSFEKQHKDIIDRFGRYPHRNDILGRQSTAEEIAFLKEPNSSF